jgi:hypothetical protein
VSKRLERLFLGKLGISLYVELRFALLVGSFGLTKNTEQLFALQNR